MPKYGGTHYPNDVKGVTNGYPTHVPNGDGGAYGDYTNKSIADGGAGKRAKKSCSKSDRRLCMEVSQSN